jgi:hypothetical protein
MRIVSVVAFVVVGGFACGGNGASSGGAQPVDASGGDAARIMCEGECRREARCRPPGSAQCMARCATLPVRSPPVWRTDWAWQYARCTDVSACSTDADEQCFTAWMAQLPQGPAVRACLGVLPPEVRDFRVKVARRCLVLTGLTPGADASAAGCFQSHPDAMHSCMPPWDWK